MVNVTFDTNCIIALEKNEPAADDLRRIVRSAAEQKLKLRVVAISASERPRRGETSTGFGAFERRIANVGLKEGIAEILSAPAIWNVSHWNHSTWMTAADSAKMRQIHGILFPTHPFELTGDPRGKWLNRAVDTSALWTHLHHGGGAFVTTDRDFHTKKAVIEQQLGTDILTPCEAATRFCVPRTR